MKLNDIIKQAAQAPGVQPMNIVAAKAFFEVTAGLIPNEPMPEYSKRWAYTSEDYAADGGTQASLQNEGSRYYTIQTNAHTYAKMLEKGGLNWVRVDYLWV